MGSVDGLLKRGAISGAVGLAPFHYGIACAGVNHALCTTYPTETK